MNKTGSNLAPATNKSPPTSGVGGDLSFGSPVRIVFPTDALEPAVPKLFRWQRLAVGQDIHLVLNF